MRRSELARSVGCHRETVRFYERRGLLPAPPRSAAGHRVYGREHARRLSFILRGRALGFGLDQIEQLLRLPGEGGAACVEAKALALARLAETRRRLAELTRLEQALASMVAQCGEGERDACPLIDALAERARAPVGAPAITPG
jgi:MerR family transcriptional regulator, mercuric resistance operon regulatory protein